MKRWEIMTDGISAQAKAIAKELRLNEITAQLLCNRGVETIEDARAYVGLEGAERTSLHDPRELPDAERAVEIILGWIRAGVRIRVIGDYDVDGVCATAILVKGLRLCGAHVDARLPERARDGYGLNERLVREAAEDGIRALITCDNGIAAAQEIALAQTLGLSVIVTDHHEVPYTVEADGTHTEQLPAAEAVVDPRRTDEANRYPFRAICGAVVAYRLIQLLLENCGEQPAVEAGRNAFLREATVMAGLATVCDVMPLIDENRTIVRYALMGAPHTNNAGLRALIDVQDIRDRKLSSHDFGFILGPCLNAAGRLTSAEQGLALLLCEDAGEAARIAGDLRGLNDSRKTMTKQGTETAMAEIDALTEREGGLPSVLVVYLPDCNEAVAGIIAGRIREHYSRPSIILTNTDNGLIKGSGRSTPAYHMFEALTACKELFVKFGGHPMAAGLTMEAQYVDELRKRLNENCSLTEEDFTESLHPDMALDPGRLTIPILREFALLEPLGEGCPEPLFTAEGISVLSGQIIGKNQNVGKYRIRDAGGAVLELMCFRDLEGFRAFLQEQVGMEAEAALYDGQQRADHTRGIPIRVAYTASINEFRGEQRLQLVLADWKPVE
ncbi:MAG: single-stranded-DNA-specific exonuclease RecJ [Butyrivibrio sp.]|nr:single-stranded-DNA-specific exonuclease RecJ [Butyrivibrio sp.]